MPVDLIKNIISPKNIFSIKNIFTKGGENLPVQK